MERRRHIFPIVAAHLEDSNKGIGLNKSLLSEFKGHFLWKKRSQDIFQIYETNSLLWSNVPSHLTLMKYKKLHKKNWINMMAQASNPSFFLLETVWVRTLLDYSALAKIVSKFFCHSQNL
jgi:hypothetical protein